MHWIGVCHRLVLKLGSLHSRIPQPGMAFYENHYLQLGCRAFDNYHLGNCLAANPNIKGIETSKTVSIRSLYTQQTRGRRGDPSKDGDPSSQQYCLYGARTATDATPGLALSFRRVHPE